MGPSKKEKQAQRDIKQKQLDVSTEQFAFAKKDREQSRELLKPAIDFNLALSSGDPDKVTEASSPVIAQLDQQFRQARENIFNSIPAGPGRDVALADLERRRGAGTGGALMKSVISSKDKLANIASGLGSFSLNELGGGLRSLEGAATTQANVLQTEMAGKAATMNAIGQLAGTTGAAVIGKFG